MMKQLVLNLPKLGKGNWWVEVTTNDPNCTYYFGPFSNPLEAADMSPGYVEDLTQEGAQGISTIIKRCHPTELTRYD